jgi:hypothetical protein
LINRITAERLGSPVHKDDETCWGRGSLPICLSEPPAGNGAKHSVWKEIAMECILPKFVEGLNASPMRKFELDGRVGITLLSDGDPHVVDIGWRNRGSHSLRVEKDERAPEF